MTKILQYVSHYPDEFKIEKLVIPKPSKRLSYTSNEKELVGRIKTLDSKQRRLIRSIKNAQSHYKERYTKHGITKETKSLWKKLDNLINEFRVVTHDKRLALTYLKQTIISNDMEFKRKHMIIKTKRS